MYQYRKQSRRSIPCLQIESASDLESSPIRRSGYDQRLQYDDPDLDQSVSVWERNRYQANYEQDIDYIPNNRFIPQAYPILSKRDRKQYQKNYPLNFQQPKYNSEYYDKNVQISKQQGLNWKAHVLPQVTQLYQQIINKTLKQELILKRQQQQIRRQVQIKILTKQVQKQMQKQQEVEASINYRNNNKHSSVYQSAFTPKIDKNVVNQENKQRNYSRHVKSQIVQTENVFTNQPKAQADKKAKKTSNANNIQSHQRLAVQKQKHSIRNSVKTQLSQKQYQSKISKLQGQNQSLKQEVEYLRQTLLTKFQQKRSNS